MNIGGLRIKLVSSGQMIDRARKVCSGVLDLTQQVVVAWVIRLSLYQACKQHSGLIEPARIAGRKSHRDELFVIVQGFLSHLVG